MTRTGFRSGEGIAQQAYRTHEGVYQYPLMCDLFVVFQLSRTLRSYGVYPSIYPSNRKKS